FEDSVNSALEGDFVFVDPPYTVKHNYNGFIKYNENLFKWEDQVRLRDSVVRAARRGAKVLVLNANHESIVSLYEGFEQIVLSRSNVLSGKSEFRGVYQELAIKCW
ncbi:DNA adenine methylase, partial [Pseudomonas aeruginosa]